MLLTYVVDVESMRKIITKVVNLVFLLLLVTICFVDLSGSGGFTPPPILEVRPLKKNFFMCVFRFGKWC